MTRNPEAGVSVARLSRFYFVAVGMVCLTVAVLGCAEQEYFKPKGYTRKVSPGQMATVKQGLLPDGSLGSHFEVFVKGMERRQVGAKKLRSIRVGMSVRNASGQPMEIDSQEAYLVDRGGEVLRCSAMRVSGANRTLARLRPNADAQLDLWFDLGNVRRDLKDFTVHWRYKVGESPFSQASAFQRDFHGWAE